MQRAAPSKKEGLHGDKVHIAKKGEGNCGEVPLTQGRSGGNRVKHLDL